MRMLAVLLLLAAAPMAQAAQCQISVSDLVFGQYRFNSPDPVETTATVGTRCVDNGTGLAVGYTLTIDPAVPGARSMSGPGGALRYGVYVDPNRSLPWGDGTGGTTPIAGNFLLPGVTAATHTVYGRIPARQTDISPGSYTDVLVITLTY